MKEKTLQFVLPGEEFRQVLGLDKDVDQVETDPNGNPSSRLSFLSYGGRLHRTVGIEEDWRNTRNPVKKVVRLAKHVAEQLL